ncbi:TIGR03943 family putative permease subunit [Sporosalibacterium faouarense]|uniref:TIGR03943 family putative permease subunit n=1 Tax=Sporosalibacterium faouarense TaxID=516123 RepID=UPI00192B94A4|nr:TIGR03943 family protein [Sporosalibacterium faouarense]
MRKFNINEFIWFIILLGFTFLLYDLTSTDKLKLFIHPRLTQYVKITFYVLVILSIVQITRVFSKGHGTKIRKGYILFVLPLLLVFIVNPKGLNAQIIAKKGVNLGEIRNSNIGNIQDKDIDNKEEIENSGVQVDKATESSEAQSITDNQMEINTDYISFANTQESQVFLDTINNVSNNTEEFLNQEVSVIGFIYRQEDFKENQFVIARMLLSCCVADTQVIGLLCESEEANNFNDSEWVRITGTVNTTVYLDPKFNQEISLPLLKISSIERVSEPESPYVYP